MSVNLTANAKASFEDDVKHDYQGMGKLRPTARTRMKVVGSTHRFNKMGKGTATPRIPQTDVIPMNVGHSNATATLANWNAPEYTDLFDQAEVPYDEKAELVFTLAGAITRREDQLLIDALDAAQGSFEVPTSIGGADSGLNTAKCRRAKQLLDSAGVPGTDRTFLCHAVGLEQMLGETDATSSDFNTVKALVDGELGTWLGFKFIFIETRTEGGLFLNSVGDIRTNFAYHKPSIGIAYGINDRTEVNYIAEKTSWLANSLFKAGAVGIDGTGIIEVATRIFNKSDKVADRPL